MADAYPVPARIHRVEDRIRRSRFVTTLAHAPDADAAHAFVERIRDEFPDATHVCWAFVAGPPGTTTHIGMSDDGEPHGTAGRPMLTRLLHSGVGEVVATCARWYGGVKLGTGGLARAYGGGVERALEDLPVEDKVERRPLRVRVGYAGVDALQRMLAEWEIPLAAEDWGAEATLTCLVPAGRVDAFRAAVADLTRGEARIDDG